MSYFVDYSKIMFIQRNNLSRQNFTCNQTLQNIYEPSPRIKSKSSHDAVINHKDNSPRNYMLKAFPNVSILHASPPPMIP